MAARLTDEQKKKIIVDYAESGSYKATAKRFNVSDNTVKRICRSEPEMSQKVAQKKAENTADMLSFMDSRKRKAQNIIDNCLDILPKKLEEANASQVATVMGIVADKFTKSIPAWNNPVTIINDVPKILENMETLADIVKNPAPNRDIADFE